MSELYLRNDGESSTERVKHGHPLPVTTGDDILLARSVVEQTAFNATGTGAIALSTTMAKRFRLVSITVKLSSAPTTSESLTLTKNALAGAAYDTVLFSVNPATTAATSIVYIPDGQITFLQGDELDLALTNTDARTYGATILCEAV